ncbi:MAG: hypothetical protein QN157_12765 [Armatimonadota bacterium]|nr:hypothetical protein [Armatimonadota bacterium]
MEDTSWHAAAPGSGARGAALVGILVTTVVVSVVLAALVVATMADTTMANDYLRAQQALAAAEAGAYRALAELRRRVRVDLPDRVRAEDLPVVEAICRGAGSASGPTPVDLLVRFAVPADRQATDWTRVGGTAYLSLGTADRPIHLLEAVSGATTAEVYATVAVRWSGRPSTCQAAVPEGALERYVMWFDYAVVAVGRAGRARRIVCLRGEGADGCPQWFPHVAPTWQGSYTRTGGALGGWPVVVAEVPVASAALLVLGESPAWLHTGARIDGRVHANSALGVAGTPQFSGPVTQAAPAMRFYACGWPRTLEIPDDTAAETLTVPGCDAPRFGATVRGSRQGVTAVPDPATLPGATNPARAVLGLSPADGPDPTDQEIRASTTDLPDDGTPVPPGVYVADQCATGAGCGGVYVAGSVRRMQLAVEDDMQVISLVLDVADGRAPGEVRVVVDPRTRAVTVTEPGRPPRAYPAGTFNGLVYVSDALAAPYDAGGDGLLDDPDVGLRGVVHPALRLTLAASGDIAIADHLVYQAVSGGQASGGLLGLWTRRGDVVIAGPLTPRDLFVDAVILAPQGQVRVEGWDRLPDKGTAAVFGAVVQRTLGPLGGFDPLTGYGRAVTYDRRLRMVAPPYFPRSRTVGVTGSSDGDPAFAGGDPLYRRPHWEELMGR